MAPKTGRDSDKFMLRFPGGMREYMKAAAEKNGRSMNAEIVARLNGSILLDPETPREHRLTEVMVGLPGGLYNRILETANQNRTHIGDEIINALKEQFPEEPTLDDLAQEISGILALNKLQRPSIRKRLISLMREMRGLLRNQFEKTPPDDTVPKIIGLGDVSENYKD